ncbi:putative serine esterase-domain-containing protein [Chytriomyces cf. hyalinus JEL632]|nr:putative serine esterase-domain-containing protein [Chytriomyces cf. hyalinus JEL632]
MHVVVLVHGFTGFATDVAYLAKVINARNAPDTTVFSPTCNEWRTDSGVGAQADRVAESVLKHLDERGPNKNVSISLVGHSLGGLVARLAAHKLASHNLKLRHYISVATPHLGSRYKSPIPPDLATIVARQTGRDLFLTEATPILSAMAQSPVLDALASFQTRTAYGCVEHDIPVGFESAVFMVDNPFVKPVSIESIAAPIKGILNSLPVAYSGGLSSLSATQPVLKDISDLTNDPAAFQLPVLTASAEEAVHLKQVEAILASLNSLTWTKMAIFPSRPLFAHEDVIVKTELWQVQFGCAVIEDIVERLLA